MEKRKRLYHIDIARAIGILVIVFGHTVQGGPVNQWCYSFNVPLFFFLTGYVFNCSGNIFGSIGKRALRLLVPYLFFSALSYGILLVVGKFLSEDFLARQDIGSIWQELLKILCGYCEANSPLWFLPASFAASIIMLLLSKAVGKICRGNKLAEISVFVFVMALCVLWMYLNLNVFGIYQWPFKLEGVLHLLFWVIGGKLFSNTEKLFDRVPKWVTGVVGVALLSGGVVLSQINTPVKYLGEVYGNIPLYYTAAALNILAVILISRVIPCNKALTYLGMHTLAVLLMHKFPIIVFQDIIPFTKKYLSENSVIVGILVSVISIGLCLVAEFLILRICPILLGKTKRIPFRKSRKAV